MSIYLFSFLEIDCGPPTQIQDGQYHPINGTLLGNQAILSCNFLYIPIGGPDFIQCLASGEWSVSSVTCEPGKLSYPSPPLPNYYECYVSKDSWV